MIEQTMREEYFRLLKQYYHEPREEFLAQAADLGRRLVMDRVPTEEIGELQEQAVNQLAREVPEASLKEITQHLSLPLVELLMAYGLSFRHLLAEREKMEDALRNAAREWHNTFDAISDGIFLLDEDQHVIRCNKAFANFVGHPYDRIIGSPCWSLVHQTTRPPAQCPFLRIKKSGKHAEQIFRVRNGWYHFSSNRFKNGTGETLYAVHVIRDISEQKINEEKIRRSWERFQIIYSHAPIGIEIYNAKGELLDANSECLHIFGVKKIADLQGLQLFQDLNISEEGKKKLKGGETVQYDSEFDFEKVKQSQLYQTSRSGKIFLRVSISPISLPEENEKGFLVHVQDITEKKVLEQEFQQAQKMEAIGRLAGGVAHDFNNLLTVINGYTQFILSDISSHDPIYKDVMEIKHAADRAAHLTRQLLLFSRKQILETQVLDLNQVVSSLDKMMRRLIGEDIQLTTILHPDPCWLKADSGQIEQVIVNLVVNARDAMPEGGELIIETRPLFIGRKGEQIQQYLDPGEYVCLSVSDNGIGMDEQTQSRIFDPFFTTKGEGKGTGLGLSTVYGIVKQLNARIRVYSEPNVGTTFRIYFPYAAEKRGETVGVVKEKAPLAGTETILLVEDEDLVREFVSRSLRRSGYKVLEARNAGEALLTCEKQEGPIHLMITDVVMPQMSGKELAKRLEKEKPTMKILFMSGYTNDAVLRYGLLKKGIAFIQKPFTTNTLLRKVRKVLDSRPGE